MIDFAGDKLYYVEPGTGEQILCPVLVCVLLFSGYSYVEALPNATLPQLVKALNNCLRFMGGAPMNLIPDNMRQVVTKSCRYEPVFTDMILAWAQHNSIHLKAARVRSPRDKPHVENEVKITYARIYAPLRDKVYHSIDELNSTILGLLKRHHKQPFQKREQSRIELFPSAELLLLQSLPSTPYVMKYATESKVQRNYHVILGEDKHFYSVPYTSFVKNCASFMIPITWRYSRIISALLFTAEVISDTTILLIQPTCQMPIKAIMNRWAGTGSIF